jgi:hypothetical protein
MALAATQGPAQAQSASTGLPQDLVSAYAGLDRAWTAAPLSFAVATFVSGAVEGYGRYTPRDGHVFAPDEALVVYAEPVGFGHAADANGSRVSMLADFEIVNGSGQVLARQQGFADLGVTARHPLREFHATLTFAFEGFRPGDYTLVVTLRDQTGPKSGSFSLPFTVSTPN